MIAHCTLSLFFSDNAKHPSLILHQLQQQLLELKSAGRGEYVKLFKVSYNVLN